MSEATVVATIKQCTFLQNSPSTWLCTATCVHGTARNVTFKPPPGIAVDYADMVARTYRQHDLLVGCSCVYDTPVQVATVSFQPANGVAPGQQRYCPQQSGTIVRDFFFGPGLTCSKGGAYLITAKVALSRGLTQGARGLGVVVIAGQPVLNVPMIDVASVATANISTTLNLAANQSVNIGYENTSTSVQDVQTTTLTVGEVWAP